MIDTEAAVNRLMRFLSVEGITGQEEAIAAEVRDALMEAGVPSGAIRSDEVNTRIPVPTQTGNLIVSLPGNGDGAPLLFSTHLDTVPLCAGAVPKRKGDLIVPQGATALGGDNRTGVAALVTLAAELNRQGLSHPPITLLFTVREESGLFGARYLDPVDVGNPTMAFNVDGRRAADLILGAVGAQRWEVEISGKASHAGVHPEQGISATMIAALALAEIYEQGWFGRIEKDGRVGTSNVGSVSGLTGGSAGQATNVVTDYVFITGESRSHDSRFAKQITNSYKNAFKSAADKVRDIDGHRGKVKFEARLDYHPFKLKENAKVVKHAIRAVEQIGREPQLGIANGGLDANWLVKHGIPTVTFGAGQNEIHTVKEFVDLTEFESGCELALALATLQ